MLSEEAKSLPTIAEMPVITPKVWETLRSEMDHGGGGEKFFWSLGADFVRVNPQHRKTYEETLKNARPSETPDATAAVVLLVLRALDMQAKNDGFQLPEIPNPINPLPALRKFIPQSQGEEWKLIDAAYNELLRMNPVVGEIVHDIAAGAPDEVLRIMTETQAKRGAVYAFYGIKAVIPRRK